MRKFGKPLLELAVLSVPALIVHLVLFRLFFSQRAVNFHYSVPELYGFFFAFSVVILLILVRIKQINIDSVGNTFMLLTCLKMVVAYVLLRPILAQPHSETAFEKMNFFIVFSVFLAIETMVTIRILGQTKR